MSTAVAVLAGGAGTRFGGGVPKPLVHWQGRPLVAWALDAASASGIGPVFLVVGFAAPTVAAAAPAGITVVVNPAWEEGMASSLRAALDAVADDPAVDALCVALADQPRLAAAAYRAVDAVARDAPIVTATYRGVRGHPVRLSRSVFADLRALRGDVGARALMATHPVVEVDCTGLGDPADIDTPADLAGA